MSLILKIPVDYLHEIAVRAKAARLALNYTQNSLAKRSGVSLGSLKRFESTGQVSLENLLKLALVLNALDAFDNLFSLDLTKIKSLKELLQTEKKRQRGRK